MSQDTDGQRFGIRLVAISLALVVASITAAVLISAL